MAHPVWRREAVPGAMVTDRTVLKGMDGASYYRERADHLRRRLEEEKRALGEDIKKVYAEAKGTGFEPKIMRQLLKIRKMDKDEHDEEESLLDLYKRALGMLPDAATSAQAAE